MKKVRKVLVSRDAIGLLTLHVEAEMARRGLKREWELFVCERKNHDLFHGDNDWPVQCALWLAAQEVSHRHPDCQHCKEEVERIRKRAQEVGEELLGSCESVSQKLGEHEEHLEDDQDFCDALDEVALLCNGCGWWDEPSKVDCDTETCDDCREDDPEEDEEETEDA